MNLSIYLARFFGIYLLLASGLYIFKKEFLKDAVDDFFASPGIRLMTGIMTLILGLLLALAHNMWDWSFGAVVTLLCYITVLKGIIFLYAPRLSKSASLACLKAPGLYIATAISLILGVYLIYEGFCGA